ncbi:hypothetical protein Xbed_03583 [Xenorhabdus beddingii]|uniref:Uncharacterized protein n=1 Tax=Xenorhabdus beddingii TaxID=40578 RepID=A0A1Y2SA24_9GAMM|nr:hypothetical protein Xbed_03583 [Xenorhabdus beddingii]
MGIGGERPFPHLSQQIRHTATLIEADTQGQGIDKETDQPLQFMVRAVGDRCPNDNIILTTEPGKDEAPGGQYRHEQGGVMALSERLERFQ